MRRPLYINCSTPIHIRYSVVLNHVCLFQTLRGLINSSNFPPKPMDVLQGPSRYSQNTTLPNAGPLTAQASFMQVGVILVISIIVNISCCSFFKFAMFAFAEKLDGSHLP